MVKWEMATLQRYYADGGDDQLRLAHYDIQDGLIVEIGACTGEFTLKLAQRFPTCRVVAYEPIKELYEAAVERTRDHALVFPCGVSVDGRDIHLMSAGPASSEVSGGAVTAQTISVAHLLDDHPVDLLIMNVEGAEYDILDRILDLGLQTRVVNFQIQFHDYFPDAADRMTLIQERLASTHELTYQYPFVFENWRKQ